MKCLVKSEVDLTSRKIAYVSVVFNNTEGVLRKLREQADACKRASLPFDVVWIASSKHPAVAQPGAIRIVPIRHRNKFDFRVKQIIELNRITQQYDAIILRYPVIDPVLLALFSPKCPVISEHHTIELDEAKLLGDWRYVFEKYGIRSFMKRFSGVSAVTEELLNYYVGQSGGAKPALLVFNSIEVNRYASGISEGALRTEAKVKMAMICSEFATWHGLDKVVAKLREVSPESYELHLAGGLSPEQLKSIQEFRSIIYHGRLNEGQLANIYKSCHVGLSSFALERKGMREGSTLKVREYLASGMPAVCGHRDAAFPKGFPYLLQMEDFDFERIQNWLDGISSLSRAAIRTASLPFISVDSLVRRQYDFASSLIKR
jgi:hypothetical protein